jgi:integrase
MPSTQKKPRLYKRGNMWYLDLRTVSGRKRIPTGKTSEAEARAEAERIARTLGGPARRGALRLHDALEHAYITHWCRTRSAEVMRRVVNLIQRDLGFLKLTEVDTETLRGYCESVISQGTSPATVNRRMSAIGVALRMAVEKKELPSRPKLPKYEEDNLKDRYMTPEEEVAIFGWLAGKAEAEKHDPSGDGCWAYVKAFATFLVDSGFRFSEAFKFTLEDGYADLRNYTTKSGKGRRVPLTARAKAAAQFLLASPIHERLKNEFGKAPWDYVSHRWARATKAVGCPDVTLHILRHTCASRLVQRGIPIYTVSKWLGHSSVKVTERYAKLSPDTLAEARAALEA